MRLFGRPIGNTFRYEPSIAPELRDLELVADAATLRRHASFLEHAANQIEAKGARFEHIHLLDAWNAHGTGLPDIIVSAKK